MIRAKNVDDYIAAAPEWATKKLIILRTVLVGTNLKETIKWGAPVYVGKSNVVGLAAFKQHVAIWFFQGAFLTDEASVLTAAQDETKGLRQWRFSSEDGIDTNLIKQYVNEAIINDEKGLKITPKKKEPFEIPQLLLDAMHKDLRLNEAFHKLPNSHQREYCEYIVEAKKEETRVRRLEKSIVMITQNRGLNDKYRK